MSLSFTKNLAELLLCLLLLLNLFPNHLHPSTDTGYARTVLTSLNPSSRPIAGAEGTSF